MRVRIIRNSSVILIPVDTLFISFLTPGFVQPFAMSSDFTLSGSLSAPFQDYPSVYGFRIYRHNATHHYTMVFHTVTAQFTYIYFLDPSLNQSALNTINQSGVKHAAFHSTTTIDTLCFASSKGFTLFSKPTPSFNITQKSYSDRSRSST